MNQATPNSLLFKLDLPPPEAVVNLTCVGGQQFLLWTKASCRDAIHRVLYHRFVAFSIKWGIKSKSDAINRVSTSSFFPNEKLLVGGITNSQWRTANGGFQTLHSLYIFDNQCFISHRIANGGFQTLHSLLPIAKLLYTPYIEYIFYYIIRSPLEALMSPLKALMSPLKAVVTLSKGLTRIFRPILRRFLYLFGTVAALSRRNVFERLLSKTQTFIL